MVYVKNVHGEPLMPCDRARARQLLRQKKAKIVRRDILTIQLLFGSSGYKQDVTLGIDAGSKFVGLSATTEKCEVFSAEMKLRTDVVKLLANRLMLRRNRRYRKTRYRQARFDNRVASKKEGWLPPSIRQKIGSHLNMALTLQKILTISKVVIEIAPFDIQKIKNPEIEGEGYQQGEQLGFDNVREYVLFRDNHTCQNCKGKSGDKVLQVHHLESRKTGGNAPNNLITICETYHKAYHKGKIELNLKRGQVFRDSSSMNIMRYDLVDEFKKHFNDVHITYGYVTKHRRIKLGLPKSHSNDAFCIAGNLGAKKLSKVFSIRCVARHIRILHVKKPRRGGERRSVSASYWIGKTMLTRYDKVIFNKIPCFISGSSLGRAVLKDINWERVDGCKSTVMPQKLKLITHCHGSMLVA